MANPQSNKFNFPFKGKMNFNINRAELKTEVEFNEKNSPVFGGALSPLWTKEIALNNTQKRTIFDTNGNQWSINDSGTLCKNGVAIPNSPELSYAWREDNADVKMLEFISTDDIPDIDSEFGTKGGYVKIYQKLNDTSKTFVEFGNACETTTTQLDIGSESDDRKYWWGASWETLQLTIDGNTYDTVRPVLYRAEILADSVNLVFFFPEESDDWQYTRFGNSGNAGTLTLSLTGIGALSPFVEFGELVNKWTDNGTTRNSGVLAGTIYQNMGDGQTTYTYLSFGFAWKSDGVYAVFNASQIGGYPVYSVRGKRFAGGNTTQAVFIPNFILTTTQSAGDFAMAATYTTSFSYTRTNLWGVVHDSAVPRVTFCLLPKYFQCCGLSSAGSDSCALTTDLMGYMCKPLTIDKTLDDLSSAIVKDGFGSLREQWVNNAAGVRGVDCLINNGYIIGFHSVNGNLITEINNIDNSEKVVICEDVFSSNIYSNKWTKIYYVNNSGERKVLSRVPRQCEIRELYADRYLLTNADSEWNAYDIQTGKWFKWTSDWNNRIVFLHLHRSFIPTTQSHSNAIWSGSDLTLVEVASACNPNYEVTNSPFVSTSFPQVIGYATNDAQNIKNMSISFDYQFIDIYSSKAEQNAFAVYVGSIERRGLYVLRTFKAELDGLTYPTGDIVYAPCLLSRFIKSYNNIDFIEFGADFLDEDETRNCYRLIYNNNAVVFGYVLSSMIENVKAIFVIQTSIYIVMGTKIAYAQFNGQNLQGLTFLTDIKGLDYMGALPDMALFWSKVNKTFYSFTGDAILQPFLEASNIHSVINSFYLPEIQSICMAVNEYIGGQRTIIFQQDNIFEIELGLVKRVQYDKSTGSMILTTETEATKVAFMLPFFTDFEPKKVKFATEFLTAGNEAVSVLSAWFIRLYALEPICRENGEITIRQNTMTDKGTQTEEKKLKIGRQDFDKLTNSYYFRYQPKYQRGVGFQLEVESDFAIQSIIGEMITDTTQIAKHNI